MRRLARRSALLGAAMGIVAREGIHGLTMQAVADRVGCSVGTVYTHFSSKGVLIADLQDVSVRRIIRSFVAVQARCHELAAERGATDRDRAAADLALFGEFFIASWDAFPEESHMLFSVLSERGEIVPVPELDRVLGSTLTLLGLGQEVVQAAIDTEVITDGPVADRVIMGAAALLGVLLISHLGHLDESAFDHRRLTRTTWRDLLQGWGMGPADMAWGSDHVARLAETGPIAPDPD
jgi:AcrR family transcriptional regulator